MWWGRSAAHRDRRVFNHDIELQLLGRAYHWQLSQSWAFDDPGNHHGPKRSCFQHTRHRNRNRLCIMLPDKQRRLFYLQSGRRHSRGEFLLQLRPQQTAP